MNLGATGFTPCNVTCVLIMHRVGLGGRAPRLVLGSGHMIIYEHDNIYIVLYWEVERSARLVFWPIVTNMETCKGELVEVARL